MATVDVQLLINPLVIGGLLHWFLLGCLFIQLYEYIKVQSDLDPKWVKSMVYFLFAFELVQTYIATNSVEEVLVLIRRSGGLMMEGTSYASALLPAMTGFVSMIVQLFFARRIAILSLRKSRRLIVVAALVAALALIQGIAAVTTSIGFFRIGRNPHELSELYLNTAFWLGGSLFCDIIITIAMVYLLSRVRDDTKVTGTATMVSQLIRLTVETGAITTVAASLELFLFLMYTDTFLHIIFLLILGRLYTTVFYASLNFRRRHSSSPWWPTGGSRWVMSHDSRIDIPLGTFRFSQCSLALPNTQPGDGLPRHCK